MGGGYRLAVCGFWPFLAAVCGFGWRFAVFGDTNMRCAVSKSLLRLRFLAIFTCGFRLSMFDIRFPEIIVHAYCVISHENAICYVYCIFMYVFSLR